MSMGPLARLRVRRVGEPMIIRAIGIAAGRRRRSQSKIASLEWPPGSGLPSASRGCDVALYMFSMSPEMEALRGVSLCHEWSVYAKRSHPPFEKA
jgi:hypothetical protein